MKIIQIVTADPYLHSQNTLCRIIVLQQAAHGCFHHVGGLLFHPITQQIYTRLVMVELAKIFPHFLLQNLQQGIVLLGASGRANSPNQQQNNKQ